MSEDEAISLIKTSVREHCLSADFVVAECEFFEESRYRLKIAALVKDGDATFEARKSLSEKFPRKSNGKPIRIEFVGTGREIAKNVEFEVLLFEAVLMT